MTDANTGRPIMILPSRGAHVLPEVREIIEIIKSIEPNEFMSEAKKINIACGMHVVLAYEDPKNPCHLSAAVNTVYGLIPFDIFINEEQLKVTVEMIEKEAKTEPAVEMPEAEMI